MILTVVPSSPSQSCLSADSDEGMEAELRVEEMEQEEEEKEVDMAAVEATTVAVQTAAVQQQQQSQPLSHPQAETVAAAAAEASDEKAVMEKTASVGKRTKESDEEVTSPSGEDETKWVQYTTEEAAKRRKLSVKQKRRARKRGGRRAAEETREREAEAGPILPPSVASLPLASKAREEAEVAWLQSACRAEAESAFREQWPAAAKAAGLPPIFWVWEPAATPSTTAQRTVHSPGSASPCLSTQV
jgi:hypothetical protein